MNSSSIFSTGILRNRHPITRRAGTRSGITSRIRTALGGVGYAAAGNTEKEGERDYHYGLTPTGLVALRFMFGERVMFDFTGREFYVSNTVSTENGWENILRADSSLTGRVYDRHGVALGYSHSYRNANYSGVAYKDQTVGMLSLMYVFLGESGFGAVDWR